MQRESLVAPGGAAAGLLDGLGGALAEDDVDGDGEAPATQRLALVHLSGALHTLGLVEQSPLTKVRW